MNISTLFATNIKQNEKPSPPYVIAEIGVNHEGNMELAKRLIELAKEGGADAVKFQSYKAETIASKLSPAYWDISKESTTSQFELFKKYDKFWKNEFEELKKYCDTTGIEFLSTPFDTESAVFLNDLMEVYKISSSDITNKPFIQFISDFKKPIILSTGASYLYEIEEAVQWIEVSGNPLALLHCVLNYPTDDSNANLGMITGLRNKFPDNIIGYSDHTLPGDMRVLETAFLLGAQILEKHFTHDKTLPGNDHYHAMDVVDLKLFKKNINRLLALLGDTRIRALPEEQPARENARRSLVAKRSLKKGQLIAPDDLTWKRPAFGISPRFFNEVVGLKVLQDIQKDELIYWQQLSNDE